MKKVASHIVLLMSLLIAGGCSKPGSTGAAPSPAKVVPAYFHVDPSTAGSIDGFVQYSGPRSASKLIDMSEDPACVAAHKSKAHDESLQVDRRGGLGNAFVYVEKGLEDKQFEVPQTPVVIDQSGCWFHPRVMGILVNQTLRILNSDPVTHNIHPMAVTNREWNHSQGPGEPPVDRHFTKPEIMIPVKCNIHSWMHSFIGVVENPYFAVTSEDGAFHLPNLPPGTYTLAVWHEKFGVQRQIVTINTNSVATSRFTFHAQ
jgi:hypothetical protein